VAELSKYDLLLSDLKTIEAHIAVLKSKLNDSVERNVELEKKLSQIQNENKELTKKLGKFEKEIVPANRDKSDTETNILNSLNLKERENLKAKLQNLISRIDYHLSTDSARRKLDEAERQI